MQMTKFYSKGLRFAMEGALPGDPECSEENRKVEGAYGKSSFLGRSGPAFAASGLVRVATPQ